jgi:hypothetical protein
MTRQGSAKSNIREEVMLCGQNGLPLPPRPTPELGTEFDQVPPPLSFNARVEHAHREVV